MIFFREAESVFFKGMALGRLTMLQCTYAAQIGVDGLLIIFLKRDTQLKDYGSECGSEGS